MSYLLHIFLCFFNSTSILVLLVPDYLCHCYSTGSLSLIVAQAIRARAASPHSSVTGRVIPQAVRQDQQHVLGRLLPVRVAHCPNTVSGRDPSSTSSGFAGPSSSSTACTGPAPMAPESVRAQATRRALLWRKRGKSVWETRGFEICTESRITHIFALHRRNQGYEVYTCRQCKKAEFHLPIEVVENEFFGDPCQYHVCVPVNAAADEVDRMMYKKCRNVRNDPHYANVSNIEIREETLVDYLENPALGNPKEREEMTAYFHSHGLEARRRTTARSKKVRRDRMLTWNNIPENFAYLSDGTLPVGEYCHSADLLFSRYDPEGLRKKASRSCGRWRAQDTARTTR
ncbi:hypothetical protein Aduo_011888 [Ancylostoma duodenale]